ncbi:MAG: class E sortase [Acidimicrobiales bacterium]|nr:class E sortase [Acidimicrobiales bacterium]
MTDLGTSVATRAEDEVPLEPRLDDGWPVDAAAHTEPGDRARGGESRSEGDEDVRVIRLPNIPVRTVVAFACIGLSALVLLFVVYLLAFTPITASRNQQRLAQTLVTQVAFRYNLATGAIPPEGQPVGVLSIPALGLHQVVVEGTSASDLMNGPGLMPGTALPGTPGNSVVAGRRVSFGAPFGSIGTLKAGARIRVVDGAGTWTYRVTRHFTVVAGERDVVAPTSDDRLTLITSNSTLSTSGRLVVVAKLVGTPYAVATNSVLLPTYQLGLSGDPSAGGLALFWSVLSLLVLVGAGLAVWRWRHPWLVYLLVTPVFVACGLFACESVARALPATF